MLNAIAFESRYYLTLPLAIALVVHPSSAGIPPDAPAIQRSAQSSYNLTRSKVITAKNEAFAIVVEFEMEPGGEGVLVSGGNSSEIYTLEVISGRAMWKYECIFLKDALISVSEPLPAGPVIVRFEFGLPQPTMLGQHANGKMFVNGQAALGPTKFLMEEQERDAFFSPASFTGAVRSIRIEEIPAP